MTLLSRQIQTIQFGDVDEMRTVLKGYLESGLLKLFLRTCADAGFVSVKYHRKIMDDGGFSNIYVNYPGLSMNSTY